MAITVKKGKIGVEDTTYYSAASPTFSRLDSSGSATTMTAVGATNIPILNATGYFQANNVERGLQDIITRYVAGEHSIATFGAGAGVGAHNEVFGFKNGLAATSIQAAASNHFLADGVARIVVPDGTYTLATPLQLPRKTFIFGNGRGTVFRCSSTVQTSRAFSISGQVAATNSSLGANATMSKSIVAVADGTKFSSDDWIIVRDSKNVEMQQVDSVSGNDLTVRGKLRHTYRSAATVNHASLVYPAELTIDNMDIQLTSATQGYGIAGTWVVQSNFGKNLRIKGFANAGIYIQNSETCTIESTMEDASAATSGSGYGVLLDNSSDNVVSGIRRGILKDAAISGGIGNFVWGANYRNGWPPSGINDPVAFWHRSNKPKMRCTSNTVVQVPANAEAPSNVYIDGHMFRNTSTRICDVSTDHSETNNSGGFVSFNGGVATSVPFYFYAVPSPEPTATRQWDLLCSFNSPATGPTSSGSYPSWSYLGGCQGESARTVNQFIQTDGHTMFTEEEMFWNDALPTSAIATQRDLNMVRIAGIPSPAKEVYLRTDLLSSNDQSNMSSVTVEFAPFGEIAGAACEVNNPRWLLGAGETYTLESRHFSWAGLDTSSRLGVKQSAASITVRGSVLGFSETVSEYK